MTRLIAVLCALWAALALLPGEARAEKRVALVIGNSAYQNASLLANPVNDANAMAELFRRAGFDVVEARSDLGNLEFKRVAREFTAVARDADIAVMYFAGHGIEVNGTNYLLPVDAKLATDFDVEDEALSLDRLMRALEPAKRLRLIILDACRDNPFVRSMQRGTASRQVTAGLAKVEPATSNTLIAFAAKSGATAEDGRGANSPFTAALLKNLIVPGRDIRIALGHVRDEVVETTGNRQEPFVSGSLGGATVALVSNGSRAAPVAAPEPSLDPRRDYEFAERVGTQEAWDSFLALHPSGFYAELARSQRDKVVRATPAGVPQVPQLQRPGPDKADTISLNASKVAVLPAPSEPTREIKVLPAPSGELRVLTRNLQTELRRVGCDPGAVDGNWSEKSRIAIEQFNQRAGMELDTEVATVNALEALKIQRGRVCPLVCGAGQIEQGNRCVAIPAATKPQVRKEAVQPPAPSARERARERARAEKAERAEKTRERARREQRFTPRPTAARASCPAGSSPMHQGGRTCCETTPERGPSRIFCP